MKEIIENELRSIIDDLKNLCEFIYNNPELGYKEYKSSKEHVKLLKEHNFIVNEGFLGIETAFKAEFNSQKEGLTFGYLCEYDALEIGHGCGHNILGTTSTGAGIVLSKLINKIGGKVIVLGTPAEETSGAKVTMVEKGVFEDIDIVMIAHPGNNYHESGESLALEALEFSYTGKSAHAASNPEKGINALDAVINTFNNINALRQHIKPSARIHGIINNGGEAPNVVPAFASAQFYVRAKTKEYLDELVKKVKKCAKGASNAMNVRLEINNFELPYDNLITNKKLSEVFNEELQDNGIELIYPPRKSFGSLDTGNVSQVCPTIHPYFKISEKDIVPHTKTFAEETIKDEAYKNMEIVIRSLVSTAIRVASNDKLYSEIKAEFLEAK